MKYPFVRRDEGAVVEAHGYRVADPYVWLENENSDEYKQFVDVQAEFTEVFLQKECGAVREKLRLKLKEGANYEKVTCPYVVNGSLFFSRNEGLQNQSVLHAIRDGVKDGKMPPLGPELVSAARILIDPNTIEEDGTAALSIQSVSPDAKYLAYSVSYSGSDWNTGKIRDIETGKDLDDVIKWVKFSSFSWSKDSKGFFYSRYPEPTGGYSAALEDHKVYYHRIGDAQSEDTLVFEYPLEKKWFLHAGVSNDGLFAVVTIHGSAAPENLVFVAHMDQLTKSFPSSKLEFWPLFGTELKFEYSYVTSLSKNPNVMLFQTSNGAPKRRIIAVTLDSAEKRIVGDFVEVVPEDPVQTVSFTGESSADRLLIVRLKDAYHTMLLIDLSDLSNVISSELPLSSGICSVVGLSTSFDDDHIFVKTVSFHDPGTTIYFNINTPSEQHVVYQTVCGSFPQKDFEVSHSFYESFDGTKVPMFVVSRKSYSGRKPGPRATYLYAYGGFNISMTPSFSSSIMTFVKHFDGVFALACIRGGGEYGAEKWHKAAIREKRYVAFNDFQTAAEHLIKQGTTSASLLCISGGSNGGLLMGVCANQRPDLFRCVVVQVPVLDMLKFHKFTVGAAWKAEYGDPDVAGDFEYLIKYSPYHNIRSDVVYPFVLVTTGDHDDRVMPAHAFKYIARLQHDNAENPNPLMVRIEKKAGHGAGKPTSKIIEENADIYAFMANACGAHWIDE
eukprot:ANDGO_05828.mRNA.1 Prolyl endopeptidase